MNHVICYNTRSYRTSISPKERKMLVEKRDTFWIERRYLLDRKGILLVEREYFFILYIKVPTN
jgi:hypothetical protein